MIKQKLVELATNWLNQADELNKIAHNKMAEERLYAAMEVSIQAKVLTKCAEELTDALRCV